MTPVTRLSLGIFVWIITHLFQEYDATPPPVVNYTIITLYTKLLAWHDARHVCEASGGKLVDISYYSIFSFFFYPNIPDQGPWQTLPLANGGGAWIHMHRRITPLGDHLYDGTCIPLDEFNTADWRTADGLPDGDTEGMCVTHELVENPQYNFYSDYNRADCSEKRRFYCEHEQGPCTFEEMPDTRGITQYDFTSSNDITVPFISLEDCKQQCMNSSYTTEYMGPPRLDVTEECWAFTVQFSDCILHLVIHAMHFDAFSSSTSYSSYSTLYIKRCFEGAVNSTDFDIEEENLLTEPNTTCGIPIVGNSTAPSTTPLLIYSGSLTWNDAFTTCSDAGQHLLNIYSEDVELTLQDLIDEYISLGLLSETMWLGIHEPDPQNKPDILVGSDCEGVTYTKWDPDTPPSYSVYDSALCVLLNTTSLNWITAPCYEKHQFICVGDQVSEWAYDSGTSQTLGVGTTLGPYYNVSNRECRVMCSDWTFEDEDCMAYGYLDDASGTTFCRLYFASNATFYQTSYTTVAEPYTFYRKKVWNDTSVNTTLPNEDDDSIFPYSCCNVNNISLTSQCPSADIPANDEDIPTTDALEFILYTKPATWNQAQTQCQDSGGTLVEIDSVNKYHTLQYFLIEWDTSSLLLGPLWTGLIRANEDDECSFRWGSDCRPPSWLYVDAPVSTESYCGVYVDKTSHELRDCNSTYQYICQRHAGTCTITEVASNHYCGIEDYLVVSPSACYDQCRTQTYNGKECWAIMELNRWNCAMLFYTDPMYCREQYFYDNGQDTTFRTCYTSSTNSSDGSVISTPSSFVPTTNCSQPFTFQHTRNASICQTGHGAVTGSNSVISTPTETVISSSDVHFSSTNTISDGFTTNIQPTSVQASDYLLTSYMATSNTLISYVPTTNTETLAGQTTMQPYTLIPNTISQTTIQLTTSDQPNTMTVYNVPNANQQTTSLAFAEQSSFVHSNRITTTYIATSYEQSYYESQSYVVGTNTATSIEPSSYLPTTNIAFSDETSLYVPFTNDPTVNSAYSSEQSSYITNANIPTTFIEASSELISYEQSYHETISNVAFSNEPSSYSPTTSILATDIASSYDQSFTGPSFHEPTTNVAFSYERTSIVPSTNLLNTNIASFYELSSYLLNTDLTLSNGPSFNIPSTSVTFYPETSSYVYVPSTNVPATSVLLSYEPSSDVPITNIPTSDIASSDDLSVISVSTSFSPPAIQTSIGQTAYLTDTISLHESMATLSLTFNASYASNLEISSLPATSTPNTNIMPSNTISLSVSSTTYVQSPYTSTTTLPSLIITTAISPTTSIPTASNTAVSVPSTNISTTSSPTTSVQTTSNASVNISSTTQFSSNALQQKAITPIFLWPCLCYYGPRSNMTLEEWNQWLASTSLINKKSLSKFRRTRECADDSRKSAMYAGVIGASILSACSAFFFFADLSTLISNVFPIGSKYAAS